MTTELQYFKDTAVYKHVKLIEPATQNFSDEELAVYVLSNLYKREYLRAFKAVIKDSRMYDTFVDTDDDTRIEIPVGSKKGIMYDGVYDIWLRDCENVTSISVVFNETEVPIPDFKQQDGAIQIPLAFFPDGGDVRNMFFYDTGDRSAKLCVSYIPTVALQYDKMFIKLNTGARCKVHISTIYYQNLMRRELVLHTIKFFVNGVSLKVRSGVVYPCDDKQTNLGCTMM